MNLACWNIRGLHLPHKLDEIHSLVHVNKVSIIGILETKVKRKSFPVIAKDLLRGWKVVSNHHCHYNGRIWVMWNPDIVDVDILLSSSQIMHLAVTVIEKQVTFHAAFVYAFNYYLDRVPLWRSIQNIANSLSDIPWIIMGDFNVV